MVTNSLKKILDPDADADDFISSSLFTDTLWQNVHEDAISSFYVKLLTDKPNDRQADKQANAF